MAKAKAPTPEEQFAARLKAADVADLPGFFENEVLTGRPHIFATDGELALFRTYVANGLGIPQAPDSIFLVGSAKTGFSLNPDHFFMPFREDSDIDVSVVHQPLFDVLWHAMLRWDYDSRDIRKAHDRSWLSVRRMEIFSGWCTPAFFTLKEKGLELSVPTELKALRDLQYQWFSAFKSLSRYKHTPEVARHSVKARLYRTREHLAAYHAYGLQLVRAKLPS